MRPGQRRVELLFRRKLRAPSLRQSFRHDESDIVPCALVLSARIAQTHDEVKVLHAPTPSANPAKTGMAARLLLFLRSLLLGGGSGFLVATGGRFLGAFGWSLFRAFGRGL